MNIDSDSSTNISNQNYSLSKLENYFDSMDYSIENIMNKYYELIIEYLNFITRQKNIHCLKSEQVYKFILFRGLKTISNVFYFILFYSKNLDMAYYHSVKSYFIYIEFIEQVTEEQHLFLNLSSRDAVLFVYKKTIYDIPFQIKHGKNKNLFINEISKSIEILEKFIFYLLCEENEINKYIVSNVEEIFLKYLLVNKQCKKIDFNEATVFFLEQHIAETFFLQTKYSDKKKTNNKTQVICYLFDCFITKLTKLKTFDTSKKEKMIENKFKIMNVNELTPEEYINNIFY